MKALYNDWYFSKKESNGAQKVYRILNNFNESEYSSSEPSFAFKEGSTIFRLKFDDGNVYKRCGNDNRKNRIPSWSKGIWSFNYETTMPILTLSYYKAEKGKKYTLMEEKSFYITHLDYEKMIIRRL
ncbi:hypothetical protein [Croceitalea sp. P059]|uniref:hypothetical protein n=1 Tax=Croceitalea sp. P059 TaxID=3075601 RepID=UPI002883D574|nr:hypothetical protein [Croceitalea sp. P059]MDT0538763.1 hypothetical protein [Croceitalea sp. P059]